MKTVIRRTFEAAKHPAGGSRRQELNERTETSEYMPSHRYMVQWPALMSDGSPNPAQSHHNRTFRTKAEAEQFAKEDK